MTAGALYFVCRQTAVANNFREMRMEAMGLTEYIVETRGVGKNYGSTVALKDVSIHIKRGEIYGLVGDNGAGKSTMLKLLAGHIYPTEGEVALFGKTGEKELERCRPQIGFMIEHPGFFPYLSVEKNLEYCRLLKGVPGSEKNEEILKLVGLWERRKTKCRELSMGNKQRLGLAVALIGEPEVLVLDEPINGLDPSGIIDLRKMLLKLNRDKNITILLSSHILSELEQTATTFGFLQKGKLIEEIGIQKLREKCQDYLEITVSDPQTYLAMLSEVFGKENYRVYPGEVIRIFNPQKSAEEYSKLALQYGLVVTGLRRQQTSLEDYYMDLKGGNQR